MLHLIHRTESPTTVPVQSPLAARRKAQVPHEQIARLAEQLWSEAGPPVGRDLEFWLKAEAEFARRFAGTGKS